MGTAELPATSAVRHGNALGRVRCLRYLTRTQLEVLAPYVSVHSLVAGGEYQTAPDGLTLVLSGAAELYTDAPLAAGQAEPEANESRSRPLLEIHAGGSLGASSLLLEGQAIRLRAFGSTAIGWLSREQFEQLAARHPEIALCVLQGVLGDGESGEARRPLGARRWLSVASLEGIKSVAFGTSVGRLLPQIVDGLPVVAALVDQSAVSLLTPLLSNCGVRPLTTHSWEGQRIQRRSLALLAIEAAHQVNAQIDVKVGPSVGFGQRLLVERVASHQAIERPKMLGQELVDYGVALESRMRQLLVRPLHLTQQLWPLDEASEYFVTHRFADAQQLLRTWRDPTVAVVSYGEVFAIDMGPLLTHAAALGDFYVICDSDMLLLVYGKRPSSPVRPTTTMPALALSDVGEANPAGEQHGTRTFLFGQARSSGTNSQGESFEEQAWLRTIGVTSIGSLNRACIESSVPELIRVSEGFHEKRISLIADEIARRGTEIDIVSIAGPSSSGKSTFIRRLSVQLKVNGITPVGLGLDDYYVDRDQTPRDDTGDFDFEALEALQLPLLHAHLAALLAGQRVRTPQFDFVRGKSEPSAGRELELGDKDVLVIEGIHGLNPKLLGAVPARRVFRILVSPLMQLSFDHASRVHASDVRLIRRMVRDRHARGLNAAQTITRWPKVRAGERRYIYPHQTQADAVFDSSLIYELSVLRVYAERYLLEVPRHDAAYTTALRLMHFLDRFVSIYPDHVPPTSILREFIGGSGFDD